MLKDHLRPHCNISITSKDAAIRIGGVIETHDQRVLRGIRDVLLRAALVNLRNSQRCGDLHGVVKGNKS
jgi:hypothetical protein